MGFKQLLMNLPEVKAPSQRKLSFKEKLKWTGITLILFFILGLVPLFGLGQNALQQFEFLSVIMAAKFGSLISLGIGPLVTASIVLQLLNGSGLLKFDLQSTDGKKFFQGLQKLLALSFVLFEAFIYVFMGGLAPAEALRGTNLFFTLELILVFQLFLGGLLIMFMDEIVSKWGFGSGLSLFIAAGVSEEIVIRSLSPFPSPANPGIPTGAIPALVKSLAAGDPITAGLMLAAIVATAVVFAMSVYAQSMKVEIPLSFGRIRGQSIRWPLNFLYTSNIPVILVAALLANVQLWARLLEKWGYPLFGTFSGSAPASGLVYWLYSPNIVQKLITGSFTLTNIGQTLIYLAFMMGGSVMFAYFWVQTSGMDARSQAKNIMNSGLQIPGFRSDPRVLESILNRYIMPLTVMGGLAVGLLAGVADIAGALSRGTGILLAVMIIYKLYEDIAKQHMMDMHPMLRRFMGG